jgi:hypothetical protein
MSWPAGDAKEGEDGGDEAAAVVTAPAATLLLVITFLWKSMGGFPLNWGLPRPRAPFPWRPTGKKTEG